MKNNSTAVKNVTPESMPAIIHAGRPVVTTALLAKLYGTDDNNLIKNYQRNASRFVAGKHFHKLEGAELKELKNYMTKSHVVGIPKNTRQIILWTERGAARHAKMIDTDQAWDIFEKLEDCYFEKLEQSTQIAIGDQRITPAQQRHVQQRVAELAGGDRAKFAQIYRSIKDHFMVGTYKDVPEEKYPQMCRMLMCAPLSGDWMPKADSVPVPVPVFDDWLNLNCVLTCMQRINDIWKKHDLYQHLTHGGSRVGIELIDYIQDGNAVSRSLSRRYAAELDIERRTAREVCDRALARA